MAIDDDAEATVAEPQPVKPALMAELTWAKLYTKVMHKDLGAISTAISKGQPTTAGPGMEESAEKLRGQLRSANHQCRRTQRACSALGTCQLKDDQA